MTQKKNNEAKKILSAAEMLGSGRLARTIDIDVPALGGAIRVRGMSAAQAADFFGNSDAEKRAEMIMKVLPNCILDGDNQRILKTEEEAQQFLDDCDLGLYVELTQAITNASGIHKAVAASDEVPAPQVEESEAKNAVSGT